MEAVPLQAGQYPGAVVVIHLRIGDQQHLGAGRAAPFLQQTAQRLQRPFTDPHRVGIAGQRHLDRAQRRPRHHSRAWGAVGSGAGGLAGGHCGDPSNGGGLIVLKVRRGYLRPAQLSLLSRLSKALP